MSELEPKSVYNYIKEKTVQPQLEGFEDTHLEEMLAFRSKLIEEVQLHQMAVQSLMLQIYRLQEGIDLETIRGNNGVRPE